jgi:fructokinase
MKILSFGELLFDEKPEGKFLGGAPLNFALNLAKLGLESYLLSRVGEDDLGRRALAEISASPLLSTYIQHDATLPTGLVQVEMQGDEAKYAIRRNQAYDAINYKEFKDHAKNAEFKLFYFGSLSQRNAINRKCLATIFLKHSFEEVFFDCNLRAPFYDAQILDESLKRSTIFKVNHLELEEIYPLLFGNSASFEKTLSDLKARYDLKLIIVTAGSKGCYVYEGGAVHFYGSTKINFVDSIGAGDAFSAGFVFEYLKSQNIDKAAIAGNLLGAYVAASAGANPKFSETLLSKIG